jgi:hypothetical protein
MAAKQYILKNNMPASFPEPCFPKSMKNMTETSQRASEASSNLPLNRVLHFWIKVLRQIQTRSAGRNTRIHFTAIELRIGHTFPPMQELS